MFKLPLGTLRVQISWSFSPSSSSFPPPSSPSISLPLPTSFPSQFGGHSWGMYLAVTQIPCPPDLTLSDLPSWPLVVALGSPAPRSHPRAGKLSGASSPTLSFSNGEAERQ